MIDLLIRNYEQTKEEILVGYDKDSFCEIWQQNETWEISLTISKNEQNEEIFDLVEHESSIIFNGQQFVIKQMKRYVLGAQVKKDITATHIYYTVQDGYQYEKISGKKSINQVLSHIFKTENRGFTWEVVDPNKK
ncbi:phage tail protein, partial [Enterococcus faecium]|nr:phage tail protein [Enterococcus faecium]